MKHLFVCGCPGSGNSILAKALSDHERVILGLERYSSYLDREEELGKDLFEKSRYMNLAPSDTFYDSLSGRRHYENLSQSKFSTAEYVGDSIPHLYRHFDMLLKNFPESKILFIYRNIWDVMASWESGVEKGVLELCSQALAPIQEWNLSLELALPHVKSGRVLPVSFESSFIEGTGWSAINDHLGLEIAPPKVAEAGPTQTSKSLTSRDICNQANFSLFRQMDLHHKKTGVQFRQASPESIKKKYHVDKRVVDYKYQEITGSPFAIRKMNNIAAGKNSDLAILGSAASFGRFIRHPFGEILQTELGISVANLSVGGARPETYLKNDVFRNMISTSKVALIEIMSARGYENDVFRPRNHWTNIISLKDKWKDSDLFKGFDEWFFVDRLWHSLFRAKEFNLIEDIQQKNLECYVADMRILLEFAPRTLFLNFTQEPLPETLEHQTYRFPHLVEQGTLNRFSDPSDVISVVSKLGVPQDLTDAKTGEPVALMSGWPDPCKNPYYPSPEMHRLAADTLRPAVAGALRTG